MTDADEIREAQDRMAEQPEPPVEGTAEEEPADARPLPVQAPTPARRPLTPSAAAGAMALLRAQSPRAVVDQASEIATVLADVVRKQNLSVAIKGREHLEIGAWQTLGALIGAFSDQGGVYAVPLWSRPVTDEHGEEVLTRYSVQVQEYQWRTVEGKRVRELKAERSYEVAGHDYHAYAEARTATGMVVGAGSGRCSRGEDTWAQRDDYALQSMAETRACSRALRQASGWIVALAGYQQTPAEEMGHTPGGGPPPASAPVPASKPLPWWAAPAQPEIEDQTRKALKFLLEHVPEGSPQKQAALVTSMLDSIKGLQSAAEDDAPPLGHLPLIATLALRYPARALKSHLDAAAAPEEETSSEEAREEATQAAVDAAEAAEHEEQTYDG